MVSHTIASIIWHQLMSERHPVAVVAALHCGHPDMAVDTAVTTIGQFISIIVLSVFALRCGSVIVDLCELVGQVLINASLIASG